MKFSFGLKWTLSFLLFFFLSINAKAGAAEVDNIEKTELVAIGQTSARHTLRLTTLLPNSCYSPHDHYLDLEEDNTVIVVHLAKVADVDVCALVIKRHRFEINLEELEEGRYTLIDGFNNQIIANIRKTNSGTRIVQSFLHHSFNL